MGKVFPQQEILVGSFSRISYIPSPARDLYIRERVMQGIGKMRTILSVCLVFTPVCVSACWQAKQKPSLIENSDIRGVFSYEHKPLQATLRLEDAAGKVIANGRTNADGSFVFPAIKPGKYRLRMLKPSWEKVDIILFSHSDLLHKATTLRVNYSGDFCQEVAVVPESE